MAIRNLNKKHAGAREMSTLRRDVNENNERDSNKSMNALLQRMDRLENAHLALAARGEALFQVSKVMFAIIAADPVLKRRLMASVYDVTTEHMERLEFDDVHQSRVRAAIDELGRVILAADN